VLPAALLESVAAASLLQAQAPDRYRAVVELEIGDIDGPVGLTHVKSVLALDDRLYLTQALEKKIRVLTTTGDPVAVWGGFGDGPGEYQFPDELVFVDEQIVVVDRRQRRLTHLDRDGNVITTRPQPVQAPSTHWFVGPVFYGVAGNVIVFGLTGPDRLPEQWEILPVLVFGPDDAIVDSLHYRFGRRRVLVEQERRSYSTSHPIVDGAYSDMAPNGELFVVADHPGPDEPLHLARYHVATGTKDTLVMPFDMVDVPRPYADSVEAELLEAQSAAAERFGVRALREAIRSPERIPALDALMVADEGEIWFREPNFGSGPDLWRVVTPEGRVRAEIEVPGGLELMAKNGPHLWAHHQDEYYVSYISRLSLEELGR
jgi:hypothetical protein